MIGEKLFSVTNDSFAIELPEPLRHAVDLCIDSRLLKMPSVNEFFREFFQRGVMDCRMKDQHQSSFNEIIQSRAPLIGD